VFPSPLFFSRYIAGPFDSPVDVVSREGLKPYVRPIVTADAIYPF
jgi:uncharacterized protein